MGRHVPLGPLLWSRVDAARATPDLERSIWQKGVVSAADALDQGRSFAGGLQVVLGGGIGVVAGGWVATSAWPLQFAIGAGVALAAYWAVPSVWATLVALDAPTRQRDEARAALRTSVAERQQAVATNTELETSTRELRRKVSELESQSAAYKAQLDATTRQLAWIADRHRLGFDLRDKSMEWESFKDSIARNLTFGLSEIDADAQSGLVRRHIEELTKRTRERLDVTAEVARDFGAPDLADILREPFAGADPPTDVASFKRALEAADATMRRLRTYAEPRELPPGLDIWAPEYQPGPQGEH